MDLSVLPVTLPKGDSRFQPTLRARIFLFVWPLMAVFFIFAALDPSISIIAWPIAVLMLAASVMFAYCFVANALMCRSLTFNEHDVHVRDYDGTEWRTSYRSYSGVKQDDLIIRQPKPERIRAISLVHPLRERSILLDLRNKAGNDPSPLASYARILGVPIIETKAQPAEKPQEGWRSRILPVAIALLIFLVTYGGFFLLGSLQHKAHFVIQNHAQSNIVRGQIKTGEHLHSVPSTAIGKQRTVTFPADHEGEFNVVIELANGQKLTTGDTGYITPDAKMQITVDVRDDRIIATETDF